MHRMSGDPGDEKKNWVMEKLRLKLKKSDDVEGESGEQSSEAPYPKRQGPFPDVDAQAGDREKSENWQKKGRGGG